MTDKNENKPRYSTIKSLEHSAKQGDVRAIAQLYEMYREGYRVEQKSDKAESYLIDLSNGMKNKRLCFKELILKDFRSFANFKSTFDSQLTIFVGGNGAGKTAVLESLCLALKLPSRSYGSEKANPSTPEDSDIKNGSEEYCDISVKITTDDFQTSSKDGETFQSSFVANSDSFLGKKSGEHKDLKLLGNIYRYISHQEGTFFPYLYYYSVKRISTPSKSLSQIETEMFKDKSNSGRLNVLKGNLDGNTNISNTLQFFMQLDSRARSDEFDRIDDLEKEVIEFEQLISSLDEKKIPESFSQTLLSKRSEVEKLKQEKLNNHWYPLKKVVVEAVKSIVPEVTSLFIDRSSGEPVFKVIIDGEKLEFDQLSAGFQVMTGLAMDIALRMAWLNPNIDKPLKAPGVILIDEIELHLHPEWQQKVILNLQRTFPNIQFIVTTHSPQVLSTVSKESIRVLGGSPVVGETYGEASNDILIEVMNVNPKPRIERVKDLEKYFELIDLGQYCSEESIKLRAKLEQELGVEHHELKKADRKIRRKGLLKNENDC